MRGYLNQIEAYPTVLVYVGMVDSRNELQVGWRERVVLGEDNLEAEDAIPGEKIKVKQKVRENKFTYLWTEKAIKSLWLK